VIKRVLGLFHLVRSRCDAILVVVVATVTDGSNPVLLYALHILVLLLLSLSLCFVVVGFLAYVLCLFSPSLGLSFYSEAVNLLQVAS
jgi:hypothetical protein